MAAREHGSPSAVVALFERIATEEGWRPGGELRAYTDRSVYFALRHFTSCAVVGGIQLVLHDAGGSLPCHRVWPEAQVTPTGTAAHVVVMAVDRRWRSAAEGASAPFWLLAVEMWRHCVLSDIEEVWLEATPRVLKLYRRLGFPLAVRGELREHWGEPCYLCSMTVRDVAGALAEKAVRSETYRAVLAHAFRFPAEKR